jgi:hypothetical protein
MTKILYLALTALLMMLLDGLQCTELLERLSYSGI